jgi:hypothetical protein
MMRFYFDIWEAGRLILDEEGLVLPDIEAVQREAAQSLVGIARDCPP